MSSCFMVTFHRHNDLGTKNVPKRSEISGITILVVTFGPHNLRFLESAIEKNRSSGTVSFFSKDNDKKQKF